MAEMTALLAAALEEREAAARASEAALASAAADHEDRQQELKVALARKDQALSALQGALEVRARRPCSRLLCQIRMPRPPPGACAPAQQRLPLSEEGAPGVRPQRRQ